MTTLRRSRRMALASQQLGAGRAAYDRGDYETALQILRPLANDGDASAQWTLGYMYDTGSGVLQDSTEALEWYHKAANQGNASLQKLLGDIYSEGDELWEAEKWYRKAADQGDADAQYQLGGLYRIDDEDHQLMHDIAKSLNWYRKAATQGHTEALYTLGLICDRNDDYPSAAKWYRKAAEKGHHQAQYQIGKMYLDGFGVEKNFVQAYKWFSLAIVSPSESSFHASADRDSVATNMTVVQIAEAHQLVSEWKPT